LTLMHDQSTVPDDAAAAGASVYSKPLLSIYDLWVLGFSNNYVWRCPSQVILEFYNQHISGNHLDVGVGTGYFLDRCRFPIPNPTITLADLNENSLQATASRLTRYQPRIHVANVLEPIDIEPAGFDTIGLNYLLHCLPGDIKNKAACIRNLKPLMNPDGAVLFGSTILGVGVRHNLIGRMLMRAYNATRVFSNLMDRASDLENVLESEFREHSLRIVGCVALFVGWT
jgi:ubiquinone/menaquinone biosynthesis C-methylase UbiE